MIIIFIKNEGTVKPSSMKNEIKQLRPPCNVAYAGCDLCQGLLWVNDQLTVYNIQSLYTCNIHCIHIIFSHCIHIIFSHCIQYSVFCIQYSVLSMYCPNMSTILLMSLFVIFQGLTPNWQEHLVTQCYAEHLIFPNKPMFHSTTVAEVTLT